MKNIKLKEENWWGIPRFTLWTVVKSKLGYDISVGLSKCINIQR